MLKTITLQFTGSPDIVLPAQGITIFVGPNNSGKSLVLREIEQAIQTGKSQGEYHIVRDFDVVWPSHQEIEAKLASFAPLADKEPRHGFSVVGRIRPDGGREKSSISTRDLLVIIEEKKNKNWLAQHFIRWGVLRLDGRSRFALTNDREGGDLIGPPQNIFVHLFQNDALRTEVREVVYDAFGLYFVLDPTLSGSLRIRLSAQKPLDDEQSLNAAARAFHKAALHIQQASDGVQAFTGIATAVFSGEYHTLLLDEPEAFLHPPLARKLGKHLARRAQSRGEALLASTHSSDFLMGCVEATTNVRVVRLEYQNDRSRGRLVDTEQLGALFRNPLMRSSNVVSALFHDGVVVTESDNDRAFYAEVYHRLAAENDLPAVLFVNAQNKQTIKDILDPLRQFGVPAVGVPDIDIVKDGGTVWSDWLTATRIPSAMHLALGQQRSELKRLLEKSGKNMKTAGGINLLKTDDKAAANHFFDVLAEYGLFVVRQGEVENWLTDLDVPGKKTNWTIAMLERMGSDPLAEDYVRPRTGDVWDFMRAIVSWIRNPERKGTL